MSPYHHNKPIQPAERNRDPAGRRNSTARRSALRFRPLRFHPATLLAVSTGAADIPVSPGVTYVIAVSNAPGQQAVDQDTAQGDYETVVTVSGKDKSGIQLSAYIDGVDGRGVRRQVTIPRQVLS